MHISFLSSIGPKIAVLILHVQTRWRSTQHHYTIHCVYRVRQYHPTRRKPAVGRHDPDASLCVVFRFSTLLVQKSLYWFYKYKLGGGRRSITMRYNACTAYASGARHGENCGGSLRRCRSMTCFPRFPRSGVTSRGWPKKPANRGAVTRLSFGTRARVTCGPPSPATHANATGSCEMLVSSPFRTRGGLTLRVRPLSSRSFVVNRIVPHSPAVRQLASSLAHGYGI